MSPSVLQKKLMHVTTVPMTLRFLKGQVGFMKERGYQVEVTSSPGDELSAFGEAERVNVHTVSMRRQIAPLQDLGALFQLWRTLRVARPEIVHSHTPKGGLLGMCAATLARTPIRCYHMRGLPYVGATGAKRWLLQQTERVSCYLADEVYCVSESLRDQALEAQLCRASKIQVLAGGSGNGVDSEGTYNPSAHEVSAGADMRQRLGIPSDALVMGFVGRLVRDKGLIELAEAWQMLRREYSKAHLLVIGPTEERDAIPDGLLATWDQDPRVHRMAMVPSVAPYYPAMDLVVLPTYREGFPNVLLEAAAMELPVVSTLVPGCIDAVVDGVTGYLVAAADADALVDALRRYLDSPALRKEHGRSARQRVRRDFAQEAIWSALENAYNNLRERSPSLLRARVGQA